MPELLSPAGNFEKLKAAVRYGADAVYMAGQIFGMRAAADNFTLEEMKEAVDYAHARNVKVYLTVNTMPRENEYPILKKYFSDIRDIPFDALIVADIGVISVAKEFLPDVDIHISTQANSVSSYACKEWQKLGATRIVLARELTLEEIREIRKNIPKELELEAFIHGSMCVSYSGRCLLSNLLIDRDANRGMCAQPCRWNYRIYEREFDIIEEKRPDIPIPVKEINGETFIMSSKDMCMIEHIPDLMESGINSFKIEGRMKSAYYTSVVTNAYRMAIDAYKKGSYQYNSEWKRELESVSHREYSTGYFYDRSTETANTCKDTGYIREKAYLATVVSYNSETKEALLIQKNKLCAGESIEILSPGKTGISCIAGDMYNELHESIQSAPHAQMVFYMKMQFEVKEGDIIRSAG